MSSLDFGALLAGGGPAPGASVTSQHAGDDLDDVRTAIMALQKYAEQTHDDVELQKVHKAIVLCQSLLADHAKNADAAMGMTPALKQVRRTSGNY